MTPRRPLTGALVLLFAALATAPAAAQPPDRAALEKRLASLLRERVEVLRNEVEARKNPKYGNVPSFLLMEAIRRLGQAEVDLTSNPQEQLAARERTVQALREIERHIRARYDDGRVAERDLSRAVLARVPEEIALIKAKLDLSDRSRRARLQARLAELRKERLAAAQQAAESGEAEHRAGRLSTELIAELYAELIAAEQDAEADPEQWRRIQQQLLEGLRALEKVNQIRYDAGRIPVQSLARLRATRMEAEIAQGGDRVSQLRQELVTVRRQEVEERAKDFRDGRGSLSSLLEAQAGLAQAELALSDDPRRQAAVQERAVQALREIEEINRRRFEAERIPAQGLAQAKAARLTAEIELVRLQLKALGK